MLKNALILAIGGVDTEESEHCEVCPLSVSADLPPGSVHPTATAQSLGEEIKRAWRKKAKELHPDHTGKSQKAQEAFREALPRRTAAKMHLLQGDASDKVRRAMLRKEPVVMGELCPGRRVYFWKPVINRGRNKQDPEMERTSDSGRPTGSKSSLHRMSR